MAEPPDLMSIGQFSSLARLSVRMLRHYDEHEVIVPAQVDPVTGYRYYASHQLADAVTVRRLRDVGFGVSAIAALLAARGTPAMEHALLLQRGTLLAELRAAQQRLALIETMLTDTKEKTMSSITVETTTLPAMTVVTLRGVIPSYADEGQLWQRLLPELERQGIRPTGPGGVIEHDDTYVESDPDESVWLPVAPGTTAQPPLVVVDLPEQRPAMATVVGPLRADHRGARQDRRPPGRARADRRGTQRRPHRQGGEPLPQRPLDHRGGAAADGGLPAARLISRSG